MKPFEYYAPTKIFFGKDIQHEIGRIIKEYGFHKILLHYGGGSIKKNGIYDTVVDSLRAEGIEFVEMGGVEPNPKLGKVLETVDLCRAEKVEMILAVGGGERSGFRQADRVRRAGGLQSLVVFFEREGAAESASDRCHTDNLIRRKRNELFLRDHERGDMDETGL